MPNKMEHHIASIERLPAELVDEISTHLEPLEQLFFRLACRQHDTEDFAEVCTQYRRTSFAFASRAPRYLVDLTIHVR